ncbi:hypothetical protein F8M41_024925 [Gigaspora margarita]|uniref:Uncharacterized protein n=1 Tax=Gigaspora margarita TaxID=4874 RepID=A0A8H4B066_GIGMA|nr:hypothetical protein F8M41_024925 [Gigaspora margarita]
MVHGLIVLMIQQSLVIIVGFSIKLVDYSIPATPGFGLYVPGNSSTDHIHGTGFSAYSYVRDSASIKTETELKNHYHGNYIDYCGTDEFAITQCNFEVKGLPNQTELEWCLVIENPFNNSQKANVSFSPDAISINPTNIDMTVSGIANNRNDEYLLLVLLIFSLIWNFDLS